MPQVTLKGYIIVPENDLEDVLRELPVHIERTRQEPGCLIFEVDRDGANPNLFHVYEVFADRSSFEAHQLRVASSEWGRAAANVERRYNINGNG